MGKGTRGNSSTEFEHCISKDEAWFHHCHARLAWDILQKRKPDSEKTNIRNLLCPAEESILLLMSHLIIFLLTSTSCTHHWLSDWRLCADCFLAWPSIIPPQDSRGQRSGMTAKHVLLCLDTLVVPQTSENAFRSVFTLNCTGFPAGRREVDRADRTLLFASSFSEKEKVVKTCRFPAACGLPTGSATEC